MANGPGKPEQTPEQRSLRIKGYEMYLKGVMDEGRKASFRSIAMALGVTDASVRYWCSKDRWEERVNSALTSRTIAASRGSQAVSNLLRSSLYNNVKILNEIIADPNQKASTRIRAVREFADICLKLKVVTPDDLNATPGTPLGTFKDELHGNANGTPGDAPATAAAVGDEDNHDNDAPDRPDDLPTAAGDRDGNEWDESAALAAVERSRGLHPDPAGQVGDGDCEPND